MTVDDSYISLHSADAINELSVNFLIGGKKVLIPAGQSYQIRGPQNYYRDTSEDNLHYVINEIKEGTDWRTVVKRKFANSQPWLYKIITNPNRTKFIDEFVKAKKLSILDIGAGWGQFSIPLAKRNLVCAIEPTPERLEFINTISDQENVKQNMVFLGADYMDIHFKTKFDLILSIGVLEWIGAFRESNQPPEEIQKEFLSKIRTDLDDRGKLIIGIENRLGLKYLLGANDDHTGIPNISCFSKDLAREKFEQQTNKELKCITYNFKEYQNLLLKSGFQKIIFYAALPDYKLPEKIFPLSGDQTKCELNKFILEDRRVDEHDGTNGKKLENQDEIWSIYNSLAEIGIAHYFAPSFYIEAY